MDKGYERILVPIDFGDHSTGILDAAERIRSSSGRLTLLHVVEWLPQVTEATFGIYAHRKDLEKIKELSRDKLEKLARRHPEVPIDTCVYEGKPAMTILETADEIDAQVIVMGTHGRSRLDSLLIGSVAERVLRKAHQGVFLVRVEAT